MRPYARLGLLVVTAIGGGCATTVDDGEIAAKAEAALKASFKAAGQAGLDRLEQDETQRTCSVAPGKPPPGSPGRPPPTSWANAGDATRAAAKAKAAARRGFAGLNLRLI